MKKTMKFVGYVVVFALVFLFPCIGTKAVMASEVPPENEEDVQEGEYNGLTYLYNNDKVVITGYVGDEPDIVIPETIHGIAVTDIAERAFQEVFSGDNNIHVVTINASIQLIPSGCFSGAWITSISIPDTVKVIGEGAFSNCRELTEIHLPENLEKIGEQAFSWSGIQELVIPNKVREISELAFIHCRHLKHISILGNQYMGSLSFEDCYELEEVALSDEIIPVSFQNCHFLGSVRLPDGMTEIVKDAFLNCYSLTEIYIPDSVTEIQNKAFEGCSFLTVYGNVGSCAESYAVENEISFSSEEMPGKKVSYQESDGFSYILYNDYCMISGYDGGESELVIPERIEGHLVTHLAPMAFAYDTIIQKFIIEAKIEELPNDCFSFSFLHSIVFSDSIKTIGERCFQCDNYMESITIPEGVMMLGESCFSGCENLVSVQLPEIMTLLGESSFSGCKNLVNINLPEGEYKIGKYCFLGCDSLETFVIPSGIIEMEEGVFTGCSSLKFVTIEANFKVLPELTFNQCEKLEYVSLPDSLETIEASAFNECVRLSHLNLPESLVSIENQAFLGCTTLGGIRIPDTTSRIEVDAFDKCDLITICGSSGSYAETYALHNQMTFSTEDVALYATEMVEQDGVLYACSYDKVLVFGGTGNDTDIVISKSVNGKKVNAMREEAFLRDLQIRTLKIEAELRELPLGCFCSCSNLESVQLPDTLEIIGFQAFAWCKALKNISFPLSVVTIGTDAFFACESLQDVLLPPNINSIRDCAFGRTISLEKIKIPDAVFDLNDGVFEECEKLTEVYLPVELKTIGANTFHNCLRLVRLYIPETVNHIDDTAFTNCYFLVISAPKGSYAIEYAKTHGIKYVEIEYDEENGGFDGEIPSEVIDEMGDNQELPILSNSGNAIFDIGAAIEIKHRHGNKDITFRYDVVDKNSVENDAMQSAIQDALGSGGCAMDFGLSDSSGESVVFHTDENNGCVTITIPYTAPVSANQVTVYYIAPDGTKTDMHGVYSPSEKTITFTTTHFSTFTIETDVDLCAEGHDYIEEKVEATCTEKGYTIHTCRRCSETYQDGEIEALGHDYAEEKIEATCTGKGYTTHTCRRCSETYQDGETEALGHDYIEEKVEATCTEKGYTTHTCRRCSDTYQDGNTEALGHDYAEEKITATCTEKGYTIHKCRRCFETYQDGETAALGHDWDEGVVTKAPSSKEKGEKTYQCKRCHITKKEILSELGTSSEQEKKEDNQNPSEPSDIKQGKIIYRFTDASQKAVMVFKVQDKKISKIVIPASIKIDGKTYRVVQIASGSFENCTKLSKVTIGKNITVIDKNAFRNCKKIKKIVLKGTKLSKIKKGAFQKTADNLTVQVPKSLKGKKRAKLLSILKKSGMSKKIKMI